MSGGRSYSRNRGGGQGGGRGRVAGRPPKPTWAEWQLAVELPPVEPGADFGNLEFACWNCGTTLIKAGEIRRFADPGRLGSTNAVWTTHVPSTLVPIPKAEWNDDKECYVKNTYCKVCLGSRQPGDQYTFSIGSTYGEDFESEELGISGPCCKMTHTRVSKKSGKEFRSMVVLGTQENYKAQMSRILSQNSEAVQEENKIRESLRDLGVEEDIIDTRIAEVKNNPKKFEEDEVCSDLAIVLLSMALSTNVA